MVSNEIQQVLLSLLLSASNVTDFFESSPSNGCLHIRTIPVEPEKPSVFTTWPSEGEKSTSGVPLNPNQRGFHFNPRVLGGLAITVSLTSSSHVYSHILILNRHFWFLKIVFDLFWLFCMLSFPCALLSSSENNSSLSYSISFVAILSCCPRFCKGSEDFLFFHIAKLFYASSHILDIAG